MSVLFFCAVVCEGCGAQSRSIPGRAEHARDALNAEGWRRNGDRGDQCPRCSAGRMLTNYLPGAEPGYCGCGCGERTPIAPRSRARSGWVKGQPMPRIPGHRTPAPIRDASGCLIWQGRIDENGYGRIGSGWAHKVLWERKNGPVPPGHQLDHKCVTPPCVDLEHLQVVTCAVNRELVGQPPRLGVPDER